MQKSKTKTVKTKRTKSIANPRPPESFFRIEKCKGGYIVNINDHFRIGRRTRKQPIICITIADVKKEVNKLIEKDFGKKK